jgi:membrane-associated phospholipid phosphatase
VTRTLTDLADIAVVMPLALLLAVLLSVAGWNRGALAWIFAVGVTLALAAATKLAVFALGSSPFLEGLRSASGHTAAGAIAYGGLLVLILGRGVAIAVALPVALLAAGIFGATRLALGVHTPTDVVVGAAIGAAGVVLLARTAGPRPAGLPRLRLLLAVGILAGALHGQRLHAEGLLQAIAARIEGPR